MNTEMIIKRLPVSMPFAVFPNSLLRSQSCGYNIVYRIAAFQSIIIDSVGDKRLHGDITSVAVLPNWRTL